MFKKIFILLCLTMISYPVMADESVKLNTTVGAQTRRNSEVWGEYVENMEKKVNEAWKPEYGDKKSTTVLFKVKADGTVCPAVATMKSSGSKEYDAAAIKTIKNMPSFGNFPKGSDGTGKIFIMKLNNDYKPEVKEEAKPQEQKEQKEQSVENKDETKESVNKEEKSEIKEEKKEPVKTEAPKKEQKKEEKPFVPKFSN